MPKLLWVDDYAEYRISVCEKMSKTVAFINCIFSLDSTAPRGGTDTSLCYIIVKDTLWSFYY